MWTELLSWRIAFQGGIFLGAVERKKRQKIERREENILASIGILLNPVLHPNL
ncbi:hypothetical protein [Methanosarcina sp. UBA411]|uniref:hypothetical protein n=1 Tax=Methanosarcina sp. UBA411 TaxID=1915589 RepID=UPI0025CC00F3|nr:hypothetical protein [Methanosarcina sp. UBA411]